MKTFRGGIHPDEHKIFTNNKPIEMPPLPQMVYIPIRQHIGVACTPVVNVGDNVKTGQLIAEATANIAARVHASITGKVLEIKEYPHPVFGFCQAIVIESSGTEEWADGIGTVRDWQGMGVDEMKTAIKKAGIVGLGGATFPTHVKMSPPGDKVIEEFILNGAECEPYLTADHRLMIEDMQKLFVGIKICMKLLRVNKAYIGIEENKLDAIHMLTSMCDDETIKVVKLKTKYPQGAEKTLIKVITGKEVPSGGLPMDVGVVVQNVATVTAIADAVQNDMPLIERIVTVSGGAIAEPKNLRLRIGTTFTEAIAYCGGFKQEAVKIVMGGPMMGIAQATTDVPVIKGTSGILAFAQDEVNSGVEYSCIRCGRCMEVCPMGLRPCILSILGQQGDYETAREEEHLLDCVECGSCEYVCPAKRNIVQYIKMLKAKNAAANKR